MVHRGKVYRALRFAGRIADIAILTPILLPGVGILLAPLVLVGCFAALPSPAFRRWLESLGEPFAGRGVEAAPPGGVSGAEAGAGVAAPRA